jgi:hypothetical protein
VGVNPIFSSMDYDYFSDSESFGGDTGDVLIFKGGER